MREVYLYLGAIVLLGVLLWKGKAPKIRVLLAFYIGLGASGMVASLIDTGVDWLSGLGSHLVSLVLGIPQGFAAAGLTAATAFLLLLIVGIDMHPKKGKASTVTAVAAFLLPMLWPALLAAAETVAPGIGAGIGGA